jgi:DNA-binding response OmpR family regulator
MVEYPLLDGKRILLVDDEPDILDTLEDLLPMCAVTKASHYQAAKDYLESNRFDLTILDIMGVEGYALLELAVAREVPAVMLTAHALNPENLVKSFRGGAASYLPKEEMSNIAEFLEDILQAQREGVSPWTRWHQRMADFFERRFGSRWKKTDQTFG